MLSVFYYAMVYLSLDFLHHGFLLLLTFDKLLHYTLYEPNTCHCYSLQFPVMLLCHHHCLRLMHQSLSLYHNRMTSTMSMRKLPCPSAFSEAYPGSPQQQRTTKKPYSLTCTSSPREGEKLEIIVEDAEEQQTPHHHVAAAATSSSCTRHQSPPMSRARVRPLWMVLETIEDL